MNSGLRTRRVAITALGIVSPLGLGSEQNARALRLGTSGIRSLTRFDVSSCRSQVAGLADDFLPPPSPRLHLASAMTLAALAELRAADPAFAPSAAVIGTTSGGMSFGENFLRLARSGLRDRRAALWLANYPPQKPALDALASARWPIPLEIVANACASGSNAIGLAFRSIRSGQRRAVLCGGYDVVCELVFTGFDALQASTPDACRPFDRNRTGLALGEGAALLALEDMDSALERRAPILAEISGYGTATDNHHLTQPHPSGIGPRRAMERALADAALQPSDLGYINAHGTATPLNDASEAAAIQAVAPATPVSSTKGLTGHALGAAGALEAVFCVLALRDHFLPGNPMLKEPDPDCALHLVPGPSADVSIRHALSNSFGFGGSNASVILSSPS